MAMPLGIGVVDTFFDLPPENRTAWVGDFSALFRDRESRAGALPHAAGFLFKDPPKVIRAGDPIGDTLREMDRFGIEKALIRVNDDLSAEAVTVRLPAATVSTALPVACSPACATEVRTASAPAALTPVIATVTGPTVMPLASSR